MPFTVKLTVKYVLNGQAKPNHQAAAIARAGIARRAEKVSCQWTLTETERLRDELYTVLCTRLPVEQTGVEAWAEYVEVDVDPKDLEALQYYESIQRRERMLRWRYEGREYEIAFFIDLMNDPRRATAWWFIHNQNKEGAIDDLIRVASTFTTLRNELIGAPAAMGAEQDKYELLNSDSPGQVVDDFLRGAEKIERYYLHQRLEQMFTQCNRQDLVERLLKMGVDDSSI